MNALDLTARIASGLAVGLMMFGLTLRLTASSPAARRVADEMYDRLQMPIGICWLVDAMAATAMHDWITGGIAAALGALALRDWWNRRGRKLASRLAAKVRDLGHRLVVVPVPGGA